jgi:hypothetical protein
MFPHSTSEEVLPSQAFHSMGFTMKSVVVLSEFTEASLDEVELPHAETVRASIAAMARGRNVIAPAYESPDTALFTCQRETQSVQ